MTAPKPLVESRTLGNWRIHAIQAGGQKLDGGAMFGVVPKTLWERRILADEKNRIPLGMRCLLVEHEDGLILVDTGCGNKENEKFHQIYGVENAGADGLTMLEDGLTELGFRAEDVSLVINTHLHFDHAGGNTRLGTDGVVIPAFPNAEYVVQRGELEWAIRTNERTAASYFLANWESVQRGGRLTLVDGEMELRSGVQLLKTPGHTPHHQSVLFTSAGESVIFLGDLVPTAHHLPLPWIMGYDVEPLLTLESKRRVLARAHSEDWLLVFEHDAFNSFGRIGHDGRQYVLREA